MCTRRQEGLEAWGGEIPFRFCLEKVYCQKKKVPRVLIVVQGGPKTLESVYEAVMARCPVVLVAESGGTASMLHRLLESARDPSSPHYRKGAIADELARRYDPRQEEMLKEIVERDFEQRLISSFKLGESTSDFDLHIFDAIFSDASACKPEARLKLAVEWDRLDVVEHVLSKDFLRETEQRSSVSDAMCDALQTAIKHRRVAIVKVLLKAVGQVSDSNFEVKIDFISLYEAACTAAQQSTIFTGSSVLKDALLSETAIHAIGQPTSVHVYKEVLSPFLSQYIPDMEMRLSSLVSSSQHGMRGLTIDRNTSISERSAKAEAGASVCALDSHSSALRRRSDTIQHEAFLDLDTCARQVTDKPRVACSLSFADLMVWAVLIGDIELAEAFWGTLGSSSRDDPIRLALLAAQASMRAAEVRWP